MITAMNSEDIPSKVGSAKEAYDKEWQSHRRQRREMANFNERRRMQNINAGYEALKALLPGPTREKMSKATILQHAADLILELQEENLRLRSGADLPLRDAQHALPRPAAPRALSAPNLLGPEHSTEKKATSVKRRRSSASSASKKRHATEGSVATGGSAPVLSYIKPVPLDLPATASTPWNQPQGNPVACYVYKSGADGRPFQLPMTSTAMAAAPSGVVCGQQAFMFASAQAGAGASAFAATSSAARGHPSAPLFEARQGPLAAPAGLRQQPLRQQPSPQPFQAAQPPQPQVVQAPTPMAPTPASRAQPATTGAGPDAQGKNLDVIFRAIAQVESSNTPGTGMGPDKSSESPAPAPPAHSESQGAARAGCSTPAAAPAQGTKPRGSAKRKSRSTPSPTAFRPLTPQAIILSHQQSKGAPRMSPIKACSPVQKRSTSSARRILAGTC